MLTSAILLTNGEDTGRMHTVRRQVSLGMSASVAAVLACAATVDRRLAAFLAPPAGDPAAAPGRIGHG